jgi:hypothetical protein
VPEPSPGGLSIYFFSVFYIETVAGTLARPSKDKPRSAGALSKRSLYIKIGDLYISRAPGARSTGFEDEEGG